jgi:hypothetical protein
MNWDEHFKRVSLAHQRGNATFGADDGSRSFLGMSTEKTISDLRGLIRAKDDEFAQLESFVRGKKVDPDWQRDFNNLKARYKAARDAAQHALDSGTGGFLGQGIDRFFEGFTSAKQYYDAILKSLKQAYPSLTVSKGDAADVFARMPFAAKPLPQPGTPPSSQLYVALDAAARNAPDVVKGAVSYLDPSLVPQTADAPSYKKAENKLAAATNWLSSNLTLVAVIAGAVAVVSLNRK